MKKSINPEFFIRSLKNIDGTAINVREQMDVDEFIVRLMDTLEDDLRNINASENPIETSFGGKMFQEIKCSECNHSSTKTDNFLCLNLTTKGFTNLKQSLDHFSKIEVLDGDNKYLCEKCNTKVKAFKKLSLYDLPENLIISLKRFEFDHTTL
jgi:ubiquitin C-terminal hydrolase